MYLKKQDIENKEWIERLNIINSITGIKPANLIGTISNEGQSNLAIFSSVVHLGSSPALIGFILRPKGEIRRHTYKHIMQNGLYTINHIHEDFIEKAHYTSAKFEHYESEFEKCQLTAEYIADFQAPFVKESQLKLGLKFLQAIPIELNKTSLIIGEIQHLIIHDQAIGKYGHVDLSQIKDVGISGLNSYYKLEKLQQFPYARCNELPDFQK